MPESEYNVKYIYKKNNIIKVIQLAPSCEQIVNQLLRMPCIAYEPRKNADFQADILGIFLIF